MDTIAKGGGDDDDTADTAAGNDVKDDDDDPAAGAGVNDGADSLFEDAAKGTDEADGGGDEKDDDAATSERGSPLDETVGGIGENAGSGNNGETTGSEGFNQPPAIPTSSALDTSWYDEEDSFAGAYFLGFFVLVGFGVYCKFCRGSGSPAFPQPGHSAAHGKYRTV